MTTKSDAEDRFEEALLDMAEQDASKALAFVTTCFVSLTIEIVRQKGGDTGQEIKIDGGNDRDITIHAPKRYRKGGRSK